MWKQALALGGAIAVLGLPLASAAQDAQQSGSGQSGERVSVIAATRLLDKTVRGSDDQRIGSVEYLMIDVQSGSARYAMVMPSVDEEKGLIPVPWSALNVSARSDTVRISTTRDQFNTGPRYGEDRISELTSPAALTRVYDFWAPVMPRDGGSSDTSSTSDTSSASGASAQGSGTQSADQDSARTGSDSGSPHILVGRRFVTTLMPPRYRQVDQIKGSAVLGTDGEEIGEIDELMIDVDKGRVAYVTVTAGGYLGIDEDRIPVPFGALDYQAEANSYKLAAGDQVLDEVPRLTGDESPHSVRQRDLGDLYRRFQVEPYWQQARN